MQVINLFAERSKFGSSQEYWPFENDNNFTSSQMLGFLVSWVSQRNKPCLYSFCSL